MQVSNRWVLVPVLLVAACSDSSEPDPPAEPPEFSVSPDIQWSGGSVAVQSAYFRGLATLPTATVAGVAVDLTRIDDSTVSAMLPTLPTQSAPIEIVDGTTHYSAGTVGVTGFRELKMVNPAIVFEPVISPSPSGPQAIGGISPQPAGGAIGIVDLRTAQVRIESGVQPTGFDGGHGAGVTYDPTRLILLDSADTIGEWQFIPTMAFMDPAPYVGSPPRNIARLSDQVWLFAFNHMTAVYRTGLPDVQVQIEDPWRFHLSVAADRAILSAFYLADGAIVFQMSTGDTLYRLPMPSLGGAAFTSDGATLYVASGQFPNNELILAVNAATGAVTDQGSLPAGVDANDIALDAAGSHLFVAVRHDDVPEVLVYDTGSLSLVGRLLALPDATCVYPGYDVAIAVDDGSSTVFVVNGTSGSSTCIWEFDMLP